MQRIRRQSTFAGVKRPFVPSMTPEFEAQVIDTLEAIEHTLTAIDHNIEVGVQALQQQAQSAALQAQALTAISHLLPRLVGKG